MNDSHRPRFEHRVAVLGYAARPDVALNGANVWR